MRHAFMHCNFHGMRTMYTDAKSWGFAMTAEFQKLNNRSTMQKHTDAKIICSKPHTLQTFQRIDASHPMDKLQQISLLEEIKHPDA